MEFDETDLAALCDPDLREAVLYELEMLHPPPPRPIEQPYNLSRSTYVVATNALPIPRNTEVPHIVEAEPPTANPKGLHPMMLWGGVLIAIFVLIALITGQATRPPTSAQKSGTCANFTVLCAPSISAEMIDRVLTTYHSPAQGNGQALYDLGIQYGIDPVFALAFFMNESTFGTQGMATITHGLGNERCVDNLPCVNTQGGICQTGQSCYAQFANWRDGFEGWYRLIRDGYVGAPGNHLLVSSRCPCRTIPEIIPVYAPQADHNDEAHYIWVVEHATTTWRAGKVVVA